MRKMVLFLLLVLLTATAIGCGTVKGIGEDISTVGRWLTRGSSSATK